MLTPINTSAVPPKGWSLDIDKLGYGPLGPEIRSDNFSDFMRQIIVRLESNGGLPHGWREEVLDLMCRQRPDIPCEDTGLPPSRVATSDDAKRFIKTLWIAKREGAVAVSPEEQDRRGAICLQCPKRGYVSCFGGCGALVEMLSDLTLGSKARHLPELHKQHCTICGCELSSLTAYPLDVLQKVDAAMDFQSEPYPDFCWKVAPAPAPEAP